MVGAGTKPGYIVLRQVNENTWQVVGDVDRRPGLTARNSRVRAIEDAIGGKATAGQAYRVIPRSEWRLAAE